MSTEFGDFLREKRKDRYFTLKNFARLIDKSVSYVSQLESGIRPAPKFEILKKISDVLVLDKKENEIFYDLAAKSRNNIPEDLVSYINTHKNVKEALHVSKNKDVSDAEWQSFLNQLKDKFLM